MSSDQFTPEGPHRYGKMQPEPAMSSPHSFRHQSMAATNRIIDESPSATIVSVSRPDPSDISPMLLSYTIEFQYKQVFYLQFALKKCAFMEEFHEKQEQLIA